MDNIEGIKIIFLLTSMLLLSPSFKTFVLLIMLTNALIYCVIQKLSVQKSFHLKTKTSFNYIALTELAPSANIHTPLIRLSFIITLTVSLFLFLMKISILKIHHYKMFIKTSATIDCNYMKAIEEKKSIQTLR